LRRDCQPFRYFPDLADLVAKVGEETDVSSGDDFSNVGAAASTL
jgi:hypothetical protein